MVSVFGLPPLAPNRPLPRAIFDGICDVLCTSSTPQKRAGFLPRGGGSAPPARLPIAKAKATPHAMRSNMPGIRCLVHRRIEGRPAFFCIFFAFFLHFFCIFLHFFCIFFAFGMFLACFLHLAVLGICLVFFLGAFSWRRHPNLWLVVTRAPCWKKMSKNAKKYQKNATGNSKCQKNANMQCQKNHKKMPQINIWPSSESAGKKVIKLAQPVAQVPWRRSCETPEQQQDQGRNLRRQTARPRPNVPFERLKIL